MPHPAPLPLLPYCPASLAEQLLAGRERILLYGEAGIIKKAPRGLQLIDAPGVVRGIAGSEMLMGMVELLNIDTVAVLNRLSKPIASRPTGPAI